MSNWRELPIPLNTGLAQHEAGNSFEGSTGLSSGVNLDFGTRGAIRARPGWLTNKTFSVRSLDASGLPSFTDVSGVANAGYSDLVPIEVQDSAGSRAGLVGRGRIYVQSNGNTGGTRWVDRGGALATYDRRLGSFQTAANLGEFKHLDHSVLAAGYDFGPTLAFDTTAASFSLLDSSGRPGISAGATFTRKLARGLSARGPGGTSALLNHDPDGNLGVFLRSGDTVTYAELATDARTRGTLLGATPGFLDSGNSSCICADYSSSVYYVAYFTEPAIGGPWEYKVLRVSSAGAVLTTATFAAKGETEHDNQVGIWLTNTSAATDRLVVVESTPFGGTGGIRSKILEASTLVDLALDVDLSLAGFESFGASVVAGVAESDNVYIAFVDDQFILGEGKGLSIYKRALTTTTSTLVMRRRYDNVLVGDNEYTIRTPMRVLIQHQPVKVGGRVLLGLSTARMKPSLDPSFTTGPVATWTVHDITDLWVDGGTSGTLRDPVCVAQGPLEGSAFAYSPSSAVVATNGLSYRFSAWNVVDQVPNTATVTTAAPASDNFTTTFRVPTRLVLNVNEIVLQAPQVAHFQDSTVLAGSVPRLITLDSAHPVGFPVGQGPSFARGKSLAGGSLAAGDYTLQATWEWTDGAQRVHRSSPSDAVTITAALNDKIEVGVQYPHFNERETGKVVIKVWCTDVNPTSSAVAKYLVLTADYDRTADVFTSSFSSINTQEEVLYTTGGVLSAQVPNAGGGVATVSGRVWVSDGTSVFASRLGDEAANNEAPSWHVDDTLVLHLPIHAGRVVGLRDMGERLAIFTEDGVWVTYGDGPDDVGQGPNFRPPSRIALVGLASQRSCVSTPDGVLFEASHTFADGTPETGGLWIIGEGGLQQISAPVRNLVTSSEPGDLAYSPQRDQVIWSRPASVSSLSALVLGDPADLHAAQPTLVFDRRVRAWIEWAVNPVYPDGASGVFNSNPFTRYAVAGGVIWGMADEPASMTYTAGSDILAESYPFPMSLNLGNVAVAKDPGGLGRVRSVQLIEDYQPFRFEYNVVVQVSDRGTSLGTGTHVLVAAQDPPLETFLSKQKCSAVDITITANPLTTQFDQSRGAPVWTGLVLLVKGMARNKEGSRAHD